MYKAIVVTAVAVTATVALAGGAAAATRTSSSDHSKHFTVVEHAVTDTTADTGPVGDSLGDVLAFGNPIYDAADHKQIGSDQGSCIRTKVGAAYECSWTTILPGGSLVVEGPFYDAGDSTVAVIGGTGKYSGAGGSMRLHYRNKAGTEFDFSFDLSHSRTD
ncbi:dirigent protein [Jatrophihabitans telluris]|uniref:allene-oxide cyclase n=1 Tax=Jatrophihabitans telluris TaxID=2038343 RepID=A0ABY4QZP0_9ACTN|nr:allene oxide cyclase family protein [Jatrophihabitans telluris]UQX88945.1 dirigent protein [Jatrophihabitans telluris]